MQINGRVTVNLIINTLDSRSNYSSRLKKSESGKKKEKRKKNTTTTIYDKRNAFSLQQKEAVLIAF